MVKPDYTFVRDGRPLHEWLPELVSPDARVWSLAGRLKARYHDGGEPAARVVQAMRKISGG